jgi:hypothetical protein
MSECQKTRRWLRLLIAVGAVVAVAVAIRMSLDRHQTTIGSKQLSGLWRMSAGPGHRSVLQMSPDGAFEQVDVASETAGTERRWRGTWELDNDTILVYCTDSTASLMDKWMADLHSAFAGPEESVILSLTEQSLTIQGRDAPVVFERIRSDPAFSKISD